MESAIDCRDYLIKEAPPTVFYIPNFISAEEEQRLLSRVYAAPKPKWRELSNRRLQSWGGVVGKKSLIADNDIPDWLSKLIDRICAVKGTFSEANRPNHILVNEYLPGQGIMPHTDGGAYYPLISTVSLGSHTLLDLYPTQGSPSIGSILVEPRSLLLITDEVYTMLHGIEECTSDEFREGAESRKPILNKGSLDEESASVVDKGGVLKRGTRVSLTIRNVPVVRKSLLR